MKISKLIKKLQSIQNKYGDIDCNIRKGYGWRSTVFPLTSQDVTVSEPKTNPKLTIKH